MTKLWSILANTFVQSIRQPIFGIVIFATILMLVLDVPLSNWSIAKDYHKSDQQMLENVGLSTLLISGLLVAAFSASGSISREIEDQTVLTVISKPVSRTTFVVGKFAGLTAAVAVAFYLCAIAFLLTVRHQVMPAAVDPFDWPVIILGCSAMVLTVLTALAGNYLFGWAFTSAVVWSGMVLFSAAMTLVLIIGKGWQLIEYGPGVHTWQDVMNALTINPQLPAAMLLIFLAVLVFVAVAVAASTRLGQITTLLLCLTLAVAGSAHPALFGAWGRKVLLVRMLGWAVPDLSYFYPLDMLMMGRAIPPAFVATAAIYCLFYAAGILAIGIALFQTRQMDAQGASASLPMLVHLVAWAGRAGAVLLGAIGLEGLLRTALLGLANLSGFLKTLILTEAFTAVRDGLQAALDGMGSPRPWYVMLPLAAGLGGLGIVAWWFWGHFARGARWAYRLALGAAALLLLLAAAALLLRPEHAQNLPLPSDPAAQAIATGLAAFLLLILVLPKTRRHFRTTVP